MKKIEKNTVYALGYMLGKKREWLAIATRELDVAIDAGVEEVADYWRDQITRTSGAIAALEEVAEMSINDKEV